MIALSCTNISKSYGIDLILDQISFTVNSGDKIGLIGANGAGKTTLLKILMGLESKDSGDLFFGKGRTIGYLEQNTNLTYETSAFDYCKEVFEDIYQIESEIRTIESLMASDEVDDYDVLLNKYALLQESFENKNGYAIESQIRGVLKGLGFNETEYTKPIRKLSGGQKSRVGIARLLLKSPDILFLDEPTNHLDIEAIKWLEAYLKDYQGTLIMISHDRYFLDQITTRIFEIENCELRAYTGNYTQFIKIKQSEYEASLKLYEKQQKEIKNQELLISKYKDRGTEKLAKRAKSREKRLNHVERIEAPKVLQAHFSMALDVNLKSGKDVLFAEHVSKKFADTPVLDDLSFEIYKGEKIGLIGPNGVGKTTLFRTLLGIINPDFGTLTFGQNVQMGYYDQELQNLHQDLSVIEEIHNENPNLTLTEVRTLLGAFMFHGDEVEKEIASLSGGEKSRVSLLKLMMSKANFLLLDEPTNHLDILSKETLESTLENYTGTVFTISHDRYFLNKICTKIFELTEVGLKIFWGNYDYYVEKINEEMLFSEKPTSVETLTKTKRKENLRKEKEQREEEKNIKQSIETLESDIQRNENHLHELQMASCDEVIFKNPEKSKMIQIEISEITKKIEDLYMKLDELLENL